MKIGLIFGTRPEIIKLAPLIRELEKSKFSIEKIYSEVVKEGATISPKFQLFEGKEGMKLVLKDMLLYRDIETKSYWPIKAMLEILSEDFFKTLNKERIQRHLITRAIWPQNQIVDIKKHPTELDACLMQLMHIGEIANKIAKKFPKFDTLPITKMIGLRNFVAHDYLGINTDIVKTIILKDLPKIKQTIKEYH